MKSIYLRNFAATAILVFSCFCLLVFSIVGIGRTYLIKEYREGMFDSAQEAARAASAMKETDDEEHRSWSLGMAISLIANATGNQILITDADGVIFACSDSVPVCRHIGMTIAPETIAQAQNADEYFMSTLGEVYETKHYVVCCAVYAGDTQEAEEYVLATRQAAHITGGWSAFLVISSTVTVALLCVTLMVSLLFSKRMTKPLDEMAAASRKFARGDFSARVKQVSDSEDEMGALIDSFNKMADSLESAEARRSEFIANISHELRTPMTTIAGFADGILDGTIPREEEAKYLMSIRDETRRLSRLVRDMLDVSQEKSLAADPSKRTVFDLTELVLQTLLSFETRATKKGLDVDPQLPDNHIMVRAEKDAITRVIYNLLDNAVKFAAPNSCITLRLYKNEGKAYVSVKDRGETIPPEDLPFIFDRFHKSDRSRSLDKDGVGLGLYLVKAIINSHDEDIAVKSEDGTTEFVFTLPLAKK